MRGFRSAWGISGHPFAKSILILFTLGAALFDGGCSGLVTASGNGGSPGPLTISNIMAANATPTSVAIDWQTSAPADSQIEYGTTTSYGSTTAVDSTMVTSHQLTVSSLKPGTVYHCRVHSKGGNNNSAASGDLVCSTSPGPSISSLNPSSGLMGASVTITGANFGATQGTSTVAFNGVGAVPTSWSATSIVAPVPAGATTGNVVVTVGGVASNGMSFTVAVPAPSITSLNPASGLVGASVTIAGANFGATQGTSTVKFNEMTATPTSWSASSIVAPVPSGATTGNVEVTVGGVASNGMSFTVTVPGPSITGLNPTAGFVGASVTITGANFGATQGTSTVGFNGTTATPTSWSATSIVASVPAGATTGNVVVTVGGVASNGASFTVTV